MKSTSGGNSAGLTILKSWMSEIEKSVLESAVKNYRTEGTLRREDAVALNWMFGSSMTSAFELIDDGSVSLFRSPKGKCVAHVIGNSGDYWIPAGATTCQCMAFKLNHIKDKYCKHILAAAFYVGISDANEFQSMADSDMEEIFAQNVFSR